MAGAGVWGAGVPTSTPSPFDTTSSGGATPIKPDKPSTAVPLTVTEMPALPQDKSDGHPLLAPVEGFQGTYASARAMQQAMDDARKQGIPIRMNSGKRSTEEQTSLWNNRANNPNPVAPPGTSNHEKGIAYDLEGDLDRFEKVASKYGFARPLAIDPVHFTYQPEASGNERTWANDDPRLNIAAGKQYPAGSYQKLAASLGQQHGFSNADVSIGLRQLDAESNFNPKAKSPAGAIGIPQFLPGTVAPYLAERGKSPYDYANSGSLQTDVYWEHMNNVLTQNGGNWARSLAAYNSGQAGLAKQIQDGKLYGETRDYVAKILKVDPATAEHMVLEGGGPSLQPISKDLQQAKARGAYQQQASSIAEAYQLMSDGDPSKLVDQGVAAKSAATGLPASVVLATDLQERLVKPAIRGVTGGLLPILDWLSTPSPDQPKMTMANPVANAQLLGELLNPLAHQLSGWTKPDEKWLAPEQSQIDTWRGGKQEASWLWGLRPGGGSRVTTNSIAANLMSAGQEIPSMAGALMAYEYLGPKAVAEALGPKSLVAGQVVHPLIANASGVLETGAGLLSSISPKFIQQLGPQLYHEMAATMTAFGLQSTVQGFGDALQVGKGPREAVKDGLLAGLMGATLGGAMHLGLPVIGKFFGDLRAANLPAADASASEVGNAAFPLLKSLQNLMSDRGSQFMQTSSKSVTDFVDTLDRMTGNEFSNKALKTMQILYAQSRETWSGQVQKKAGASLQQFSNKVMEARSSTQLWFQKSLQQAGQLKQQLAADSATMEMWKNTNGTLVMDPKFQAAASAWEQELQMREAAGKMGQPRMGLFPETQRAIDALKLKPADVVKLGEYMGLDFKIKQASQNLQKLAPALDPALPDQLKSDDEVWGWLQNSVFKMGQYVDGATSDLQIDAPGKLMAALATANVQNQEAVVDALVGQYGDSIKSALASGGLTTAFTQRIASQISLIGKTVADANPLGSSAGRVAQILGDLDSRIKNANEILALKPGEEPSARRVYEGDKETEEAFRIRDQAHQATIQELNQAQEEAAATLVELIPQRDALQALATDMDVQSVPERIKRAEVTAGEAAFQDALRANNLDQKTFSKIYHNLSGKSDSMVFTADEAMTRWRSDKANRKSFAKVADAGNKKKNPKGWKTADITVKRRLFRKEANVAVNPTLPRNEQLNWVNQQVRKMMWEDPRSPFVPNDVHLEMKAARDSGDEFIQASVPVAWVGGATTSPGMAGLQDTRSMFLAPSGGPGYRGAGDVALKRPMLIGSDTNGLKVLDGDARLAVSKAEGKPVVTGLIRKSVLDSEMKNRFGQIHDDISNNTGAESAVGAVRESILAGAENHWLGMNYDTASQASLDELHQVAMETNRVVSPSLQAYRAVQGTTPPTPWTARMGSFLQLGLEQNASFNTAMKEWLFNKTPMGLRPALARTFSCLENLHTQHNVNNQLVQHLIGEMAQKLDSGIRGGTIPVAGAAQYRKTGELPDTFRDAFSKAVDSLQGDGNEMQTFLRDNPGMQEIMGATFDMMRIMEEYQVTSPELESAFRQNYWPLRFPELGKLKSRRSSGMSAGAFAGTHLQNEQLRSIPTFAKGQELFTAADTELLNGRWDAVESDPGKIPLTSEERIRRFNNMDAGTQKILLPSMESKELADMEVHLALRNPILDPVKMLQGHMQSILKADLVRDTVRSLTNIPVPGAGADARMVMRFKPGEKIPSVPTMRIGDLGRSASDARGGLDKGETSAPYQPLSSLFGTGSMKFAGVDVPLSELYAHPDVIAHLQKYYNIGDTSPTFWKGVLELTRSMQLAGIGITYQGRLMANHSAQIVGMGARNILQGNVSTGAKQMLVDSWSAPFQLMAMGRAARQDATMLRQMQLEGVNLDSVNFISRAITSKLGGMFDESNNEPLARMVALREGVGEAFDTLMGKTNRVDNWGELRLLEQAKVKAADFANLGLTASRALENWGMHQPLRDALVGAHLYWKNIAYEGAFAHDGSMSKDAALRLAGQQAAEMVNKLTGTMQGYLSTNSYRNAMGNAIWGMTGTTPGVMRTEIHSVAQALGSIPGVSKLVGGTTDWGHRALAGMPEQEKFFQDRARDQIAGLMLGGFLALQFKSLLINGHTTFANEPGNPAAAFKLRMGDKFYDDSSNFGATARIMKLFTGMPEQGFARMIMNQLQGPVAAIPELAGNKDRAGNPILVNNDPGPMGLKNAMRTGGYLLSKTLNTDQFLGPPDDYLNPAQRLANFMGIVGSDPATPEKIAGRVNANLAEEDKDRVHQMKKWERQYVLGPVGDSQIAAMQEMQKIAVSGPNPWDGQKFVNHISKLAMERATRDNTSAKGRTEAENRAFQVLNQRVKLKEEHLLQEYEQNARERR